MLLCGEEVGKEGTEREQKERVGVCKKAVSFFFEVPNYRVLFP